MMTYSFEDLMKRPMNGPDGLRSIARQRFRELGQQTTWIQGCDKGDIVDAIIQGAPPMDAPLDDVNTDVNTETNTPGADLAATIAQAIQSHLHIQPDTATVDEETVRAIVKAELAGHVKRVQVTLPDGNTTDVGKQHKQFGALLTVLTSGVPVYLVGPSGSGKTHAAESAAKALGLDFYCQSVSQQTTVSYLVGYMDATGQYVRSLFRDAYEKGGVYLLDEIDAGNPNVLTVLNSAISNNVCAFPDGMIKRHDDFRLIAAANTYGHGADRQYVGRMQLDAACLNRFVTLNWDYDESLEREIAGNTDWTEYVQKIRRAAGELQLRVVISPRASIYGATLLAVGMPQSDVETAVLFAGLDTDTVSKLKERVAA